MVGGTATGRRTIHIVGTKGEIYGEFDSWKYTVSLIDPSPGCEHKDYIVDSNVSGDSHGGGDLGLMRDFLAYAAGEKTSLSCTSIDDTVSGHLVVFLADKSRENNGAVQVINLD